MWFPLLPSEKFVFCTDPNHEPLLFPLYLGHYTEHLSSFIFRRSKIRNLGHKPDYPDGGFSWSSSKNFKEFLGSENITGPLSSSVFYICIVSK